MTKRATLGHVKTLPRRGSARKPWVALVVGLLRLCPAFGASRPQPALTSPDFQAVPLERSRQNHLLLHAEINGKRALLGVDSGAPVSAISTARREHFGLTAPPGSSKLPSRLRINGDFNRVAIAHRLRLGA